MRMENEYLVTAKSAEAIDRIIALWGHEYGKEDECTFENYGTTVYDAMESIIKVVHKMETSGQKDDFVVVGKCDTDYDVTIFSIEYSGDEPLIKASCADPEENEGRYYQFYDAEYDEIPKLLKRNKNRTFKQAIKDELPLGGFLDMSYDEWVKSILAE